MCARARTHARALTHPHTSNAPQAFQNSCVVVDLCAHIPALWPLLLSMFQRDCPLLVPSVVRDSAALSDDALKSAMGMKAGEMVRSYRRPVPSVNGNT
jgi:GLE1-like protein